MSTRIFTISILGLVALITPARASFSFYTDSPSFTTAASGLTISSLTTFTAADLDGPANIEYSDPTTGVDFFDFHGNGTSDTFLSSGSTIVQHTAGNLIEITLPSSTFAFAGNFTVTTSNGANLCIEPGASSFSSSSGCNINPAFLTQGNTAFYGIVSTTAFNTIWIGPASGQPTLEVLNFEVGSQSSAPEVGTLTAMGTGLILLGLICRRARRLAA